MILYLDTSLLVATLVREPGSERVQAGRAAQDPQGWTISDWVVTEFSSALSIKLRSGQLAEAHRAAALANFTALATHRFAVLPVERHHFRDAARFADQHALGLRSGDALHLAVCADQGATLCTLDRRMAQAALALGISTQAP